MHWSIFSFPRYSHFFSIKICLATGVRPTLLCCCCVDDKIIVGAQQRSNSWSVETLKQLYEQRNVSGKIAQHKQKRFSHKRRCERNMWNNVPIQELAGGTLGLFSSSFVPFGRDPLCWFWYSRGITAVYWSLGTSWMSLGPLDWIEVMHNEKIVSVCFVKIGHFGTESASTGTWGPVEWGEDQLNESGTTWLGWGDTQWKDSISLFCQNSPFWH